MKPRNGQPRFALVQRALFIARWSRDGSNTNLQGCERGVGIIVWARDSSWRGLDPVLNHRVGTR